MDMIQHDDVFFVHIIFFVVSAPKRPMVLSHFRRHALTPRALLHARRSRERVRRRRVYVVAARDEADADRERRKR